MNNNKNEILKEYSNAFKRQFTPRILHQAKQYINKICEICFYFSNLLKNNGLIKNTNPVKCLDLKF